MVVVVFMGMGKMEEKLKMRGLNLYYNMGFEKKVVLISCGGMVMYVLYVRSECFSVLS